MRFCSNKPNQSREEAEEILLQPKDKIAVDIETVSLLNRLPLGIAVAVSSMLGFYFFDVRDDLLSQALMSSEIVLFHNSAFDIPILDTLGLKFKGFEDTMLLAYSCGILDKSLDSLSANILHSPYTSVTTQWHKKDSGNIAIDHVEMGKMSIQHACNTYALWEKLPKTELYKTIDRPCIDLVIEMEHWGILIDQHQLTEVEQVAVVRANKLEVELKAELGDINLASNLQVVTALQAKGILGTRKTKSGAESVSEESLRPLDNPVTNKLLEWRSVRKTLSTYILALRTVDSRGRIRTTYGYTDTGRWKSSHPNLQNLTRDEKFSIEEEE